MEIIEKNKRTFMIQLSPHEYEQMQRFCVMVYLDADLLIHLFFRSLYNFVIQFLMMKGEDGTGPYGS